MWHNYSIIGITKMIIAIVFIAIAITAFLFTYIPILASLVEDIINLIRKKIRSI